MIVWLALRRLLPLLAVVGLALAPVAASAAAGGMGMITAATPDHAHHAAMPDMDMSDMAAADTATDEMPCCPGKAPAMPDCGKGCPLMALCLAQLASVVPTVDPEPVRTAVPVSPRWHGETAFASLASRPPPEPPRS